MTPQPSLVFLSIFLLIRTANLPFSQAIFVSTFTFTFFRFAYFRNGILFWLMSLYDGVAGATYNFLNEIRLHWYSFVLFSIEYFTGINEYGLWRAMAWVMWPRSDRCLFSKWPTKNKTMPDMEIFLSNNHPFTLDTIIFLPKVKWW